MWNAQRDNYFNLVLFNFPCQLYFYILAPSIQLGYYHFFFFIIVQVIFVIQ
jgi:hypothetical protein